MRVEHCWWVWHREPRVWEDAHWLGLDMIHMTFVPQLTGLLVTQPRPASEPGKHSPTVRPEGGTEKGEGTVGR